MDKSIKEQNIMEKKEHTGEKMVKIKNIKENIIENIKGEAHKEHIGKKHFEECNGEEDNGEEHKGR